MGMKSKTLIVSLLLSFSMLYLASMSNSSAEPAPAASTPAPTAPAPSADAPAGQDAGMGGDAGGGEYSTASREYHLKAAFLRYVAKFVEWPTPSMQAGTINLCVMGLVPSFDAINSINGKVVNDRTIVVTKIESINDAKAQGHCQILFVTKTELDNAKNIINGLQNLPILSFGDMEGFAEQGGAMNFYILNNRLAIMINPPVVENAKLKIDPRMLRLVTVVPPIK
jgi:hypothetical protein